MRVRHKTHQIKSLNSHPRKKKTLLPSDRSAVEAPVPGIKNKNNNSSSKIEMQAKLAVITEMQADHKNLVKTQTITTHKIKVKTIENNLLQKKLVLMSRKISRMTLLSI